ncbi:hypothetical protein D3C74_105430 [compost metagenome]
MLDSVKLLEEERQRLNAIGQRSLEQSIPLFDNEQLQVQSRLVDDLLMQLYREKKSRR